MQETEFFGQLFTYIVTTNTIIFATTKTGINQETHFLKCLISLYSKGVVLAEAGKGESICTGCIKLLCLLELILSWISAAGGGGLVSAIDEEMKLL